MRQVLRIEQPLNVDRLNISKAELADDRCHTSLYRVPVEAQSGGFLFRFYERQVELLNEISNRERTLGSATLCFLGEFDIGQRPYVTRRPIFIINGGKPLADEAASHLAVAVYFRNAEADIPCAGFLINRSSLHGHHYMSRLSTPNA